MAEGRMELEAKVAVEDLGVVAERLAALGARRVGRWRETDRFFDFSDGRLKESDSALRLRERVEVDGERRWRRLTFKGPRVAGRLKHRREIELEVGDLDALGELLEALGLREFAAYTKGRTTYELDGCDVELDELEGIGRFVEVEGASEEAIEGVLGKMGLGGQPTITESYLAMVLRERL